MNENTKEPLVLIGGPISEYKLNTTAKFMKGIKSFTYKNKVVVLVDNSPTASLRDAIEKKYHVDFPFYVISTPCQTYVRERLVDGRNLLRDIILKKTDSLKKYELSKEDRAKVDELMSKYDFDYFLSLEQDVIPPVNVIEKLMASDKDVIEAVYFNQKQIETPQGPQLKIIPMAWTWPDPDVKELELLTDMTMEHLVPSRVQSVAAIGLGCALIKKKVLVDINPNPEKDDIIIKPFEGFRYAQDKYACDDMYFSIDAGDAGYKLFIDSYLWCEHLHGQWDLTKTGER